MNRVILLFLIVLFTYSNSFGEVYISDHFDAQDDWTIPRLVCPTDPDRMPPAPWYYDSCTAYADTYIDSTAAHGGSGKGVGINFPADNALAQQKSIAAPSDIANGKAVVWVGFWYKHNASWSWGSDQTMKWFKFTTQGGNTNLNYDQNHRFIPPDSSLLKSDMAFNLTDDTWHYYVVYVKHSTGAGIYDGELRLWQDGIEAIWTVESGATTSNTTINWGSGSTFTDTGAAWGWGWQDRDGWPDNNNKAYWDDIIIASTEAEVLSFLGVSALTTSGQCGSGTGSFQ